MSRDCKRHDKELNPDQFAQCMRPARSKYAHAAPRGSFAVGQGWGVNDLQRRIAADAMFDENLAIAEDVTVQDMFKVGPSTALPGTRPGQTGGRPRKRPEVGAAERRARPLRTTLN